MAVDDVEYSVFKKHVLALTGLDLNLYKPDQMYRRLKTIMERAGAPSLAMYAKVLQGQPARLQEFRDFVTINVSEFYRDARLFDQLRRRVLPAFAEQGTRVKAWSAGCSFGAEPYTLAMLLDEAVAPGRWSVLATDIDQTIVGRARQGTGYLDADVRGLPPDLAERYLVPRNGSFDVAERIRRQVTFRVQNLLADRFDTGFDLILCRNVVIYFTEPAKQMLFRKFQQALKPNGILFIGGTEIIPRSQELGLEPVQTSLYRRAG